MPNHCYDILSGYKAAKKNPLTDDYNVTYDAELQQVSVSDGHKYITVCEGHNNLISSRTLAQAKLDRFDSTQWCYDCKGFDYDLCNLIVKVCHRSGRTVGEIALTCSPNRHLTETESNYIYRKLLELES